MFLAHPLFRFSVTAHSSVEERLWIFWLNRYGDWLLYILESRVWPPFYCRIIPWFFHTYTHHKRARVWFQNRLWLISTIFQSTFSPYPLRLVSFRPLPWTEPMIDQENGIITFQLRSERSGNGNGRVYTITITAADTSNNTTTANIEITVPHDKKKK